MARGRIDHSRIAALARGPGVDTRYHLVLAFVDSVVVDPDEGVFVDVSFIPNEEPETALMGVPYAGNGFGVYTPLYEDDVVLVAIPDGDTNTGPVVIARMWSKADKPPAEVSSATSIPEAPGMKQPSDDFIIRAKPGAHTKIIVSSGANVTIKVEGAGNVNLMVAGGSVNLGSDSHTPTEGTLNGASIDPFTGSTHYLLGNASTKVFNKKS